MVPPRPFLRVRDNGHQTMKGPFVVAMPDWGEATLSLRPGDKTVLQEDMVIHIIPGIWLDDWGLEISECVLITPDGGKPFCRYPRELVVKD